MSSTRFSHQPLQIYQDPTVDIDRAPMPTSQSTNKSPLRTIKNAASRRNIVFNPPQNGPSKRSPSKHNSSSPTSRAAPYSHKLNMVSMPPPGGKSYNHTDSMEKKPSMTRFKPQKALFNTFPSANEKENDRNYYHVPIAPYDNSLPRFSLGGLYPQPPPQKRKLMEAAPIIHEARPLKKAKADVLVDAEESMDAKDLPAPDSFPPLVDDGSKPPHSYAQLIGMSILRAPNRRLTLAQIYKWISDTYSFYGALDAGWQNSIRHNLSLNKAFIKQERPKDDPGKGNYWAIQPGMAHQFVRDKNVQKPAGPNENLPVQSLQAIQPEPAQYKTLIPAPELPPQSFAVPEPQLPQQPSSDATIPASDAIVTEPEEEVPSSPLIQSSPPAMMHSSPPVVRRSSKRHDTPPPVPRFPLSSASRSHKRKYASMDDSGYISSLDSSALRSTRPGLMHSDFDRPRVKRGRAEEEIARLRGSSYDSPTKNRACFLPPSSSPLRVARVSKTDGAQMLPPLTPAIKLKPPMHHPPSVSPNTNLRIHRDRVRELVGSPLRGMTTLEDSQPWSPAFNLDDSTYLFPERVEFDIFADASDAQRLANGSPEKRSAKRPCLGGRSRSAHILSEISQSHREKSAASTPLLKVTPNLSHANSSSHQNHFSLSPLASFRSPIKFDCMGHFGNGYGDSPIKLSDNDDLTRHLEMSTGAGYDFFGSEFLNEHSLVSNLDENALLLGDDDDAAAVAEEGWDILGGFAKIGATGTNGAEKPSAAAAAASTGTVSNASNHKARGLQPSLIGGNSNARPALGGRSFTNRF